MGAKDLEDRAREALGLAADHARDAGVAAHYADQAVRLAEEIDDPVLLATALDARLATRRGPDDIDIRLGTSLRLLGLVRHVPDPDVRLAAHMWRLTTALEQLELGPVRRQLAALDLLADETQEDRARFFACSRRAMFALTEGDSVGAARLTAEAAEAGATAGVPETDSVLLSLHAELARHRGERTVLVHHAEALEVHCSAQPLPATLAEAAVLWLEGGEPEEAGRLVDLLAPDLPDLRRDDEWLLVVSKLCEAAAGTGRTDTAATCAGMLGPYAGRAVLKPAATMFAGVVDDYLALATGEAPQADRAREAYRQIGATWWARRGPLGRPADLAPGAGSTRVLHLHRAETEGATRLWCVGREGAMRMVPSMRGLEYLRLLVERPGVDVRALDLVAAVDDTVRGSGTGTLVDQQALAEHRRRLPQQRAGKERVADHEQVEQARATVRKAIQTALARLELHDGEVAHVLRSTVRTGATCRYEPDPFQPVEWRLSHARPATRAERGT